MATTTAIGRTVTIPRAAILREVTIQAGIPEATIRAGITAAAIIDEGGAGRFR